MKLLKMRNFTSSHNFFFVICILTYSHMTPFDASGKEAFWKHCGKRRNRLYKQFLLFPQCFLLSKTEIIVFSSAEHNMLGVSYCDQSMSSVRPSVYLSVREQLLKKIFSSETGQQISMKLHRNNPWVMHFQKTSKIWILWRTLVAMATERKKL